MDNSITNVNVASNNINRSVERENATTASREENNQSAKTKTEAPNEPQLDRANAALAQQNVREISTNITSNDEAISAVERLRSAIAESPEQAINAQARNVSQPTVEAAFS